MTAQRHSDDSHPAEMPKEEPTVPNPNAAGQGASGYPARWPK